MPEPDLIIVFSLNGQRYALPLQTVERAVRVVAINVLPMAPAIVRGVINFMGAVLPVIDLRRRFALPPRELALSDILLVVRSARRRMALLVDAVQEVAACPARQFAVLERAVAGGAQLAGVLKLEDGLVFISDLDRLLALEEEQALDQALQGN